MSRQCQCGRGYRSDWDNQCGNCRSKKKQKAHQFALGHLPDSDYFPEHYMRERYWELRRLCK